MNKAGPSPEQQTLTLQQALALAVQHHNAGDLAKAENIYQQILQTAPNYPEALHLLGVISPFLICPLFFFMSHQVWRFFLLRHHHLVF